MSETFGQVWVVRTTHEGTGQPVEGVFDELCRGRARIGWSSYDNQDLRKIDRKIRNGENLTPAEGGGRKGAKRCLPFLTKVQERDLLLYPHQPERDLFSIVQVTTGEYGYDAGLDEDFRSVRPCKLIPGSPVNMRDGIVIASLRDRLGKPSRISLVDATGYAYPLKYLLDNLPTKAGKTQDSSGLEAIDRIRDMLREGLPDTIRQEFNGAALSRQLCHQLFERMGYVHNVQEGPGEAGADIVVTVDDTLLPDEGCRVGVQVFAFGGSVHEGSLKGKLNQLLAGWETNGLDYGVLLTTGTPTNEALAVLVAHNKENPERHVKLIDGNMLADLFLKHFPPG